MHDALRHLLINTYDYRDNRGVIMMITMMAFFIITQHYSLPPLPLSLPILSIFVHAHVNALAYCYIHIRTHSMASLFQHWVHSKEVQPD